MPFSLFRFCTHCLQMVVTGQLLRPGDPIGRLKPRVLSCIFFVMVLAAREADASVLHHLVCYGGLREANIEPVARYADILIVGDVKEYLLSRIRKINPDIIILKYQHIIGFHPAFSDWNDVSGHDEWFVHDSRTAKRMTQKRYGWYLMNISNASWRKFIVNRVISTTPKGYDGIFIDDMWERYIDKFMCEGSAEKAAPGDIPLSGWHDFMILCLKAIKKDYKGLVYLNGISEKYIDCADGAMHESFVHASWSPDSFIADPSSYRRSLLTITRVQGYGKKILVQSGTEGQDKQSTDRLFDYCLSSFFLICGGKTSFSFQPVRGYYFRELYPGLQRIPDLGDPLGPYRIVRDDSSHGNLLANNTFDEGLASWKTSSGLPAHDRDTGVSGASVRLAGTGIRKDRLTSGFIQVKEATSYRIGVWCRASRNTPGSMGYMKLGVQGRFYDRHKKILPGAYDLQVDAGSFDWQPYEATYHSPSNASFFRMSIGFIGNGTGKGWIDEAYFGEARPRACIARRDFRNGSVFVNFGDREGYVKGDERAGASQKKTMIIGPQQGVILPWTAPAQ